MNRKILNMNNKFKDLIEYNNLDKNTSRFRVVRLLMDDFDDRPSIVTQRIINDILDGNWNTYYELLPDVDWNDYSVDELGGSVRLHNLFWYHKIKTISDARSLTYDDTKKMKSFGKKSWEELQDVLSEVGI